MRGPIRLQFLGVTLFSEGEGVDLTQSMTRLPGSSNSKFFKEKTHLVWSSDQIANFLKSAFKIYFPNLQFCSNPLPSLFKGSVLMLVHQNIVNQPMVNFIKNSYQTFSVADFELHNKIWVMNFVFSLMLKRVYKIAMQHEIIDFHGTVNKECKRASLIKTYAKTIWLLKICGKSTDCRKRKINEYKKLGLHVVINRTSVWYRYWILITDIDILYRYRYLYEFQIGIGICLKMFHFGMISVWNRK